jgi:hypothetical protein
MELTQVLIIVGVIGAIVLVIIALRGSFKSDDAFYGDSTTVAANTPPLGPARSGGDGDGHGSSDGDVGAGGDGAGGGGADSSSGSGGGGDGGGVGA